MRPGLPYSVQAIRARIAEIKSGFNRPAPAGGASFAACLRRARAPRAPDDPEIAGAVAECAERFDLDPALLHAVIDAESGANRLAVSPKGAQGLMQLMPGTADALGVSNPFDVRQNIAGGSAYLRQQLDRFGRLDLALAAYNAGPGAVARYNGIPPYRETQGYVARVMAAYDAARRSQK
jgi:soluble lytic murein transglycosylase-like protein